MNPEVQAAALIGMVGSDILNAPLRSGTFERLELQRRVRDNPPYLRDGSPLHRWRLSLVLFAFALTACGFAQPNPVSQRTVYFTVFAAEPIEGLAFVAPDGTAVPLRFYPTERSPRLQHRGRGPIRIVEARGGAVVAEVSVPAELREVLLLVQPRPAGGPGPRVEVTVLDDSARQRAGGQIQILNLSGLALTGELNGRRIELQAGMNPALNAGRSARVVLRTTFRGRSYTSWHDTIALGPTERALLVLFPPFLAGSVEVQTRVLLDGTTSR
jgi:hypothetical protein